MEPSWAAAVIGTGTCAGDARISLSIHCDFMAGACPHVAMWPCGAAGDDKRLHAEAREQRGRRLRRAALADGLPPAVAPAHCCSSGAPPPEDSSQNFPPGDRRNYSGCGLARDSMCLSPSVPSVAAGPTLCCSSGALPPEDSSRNLPPGDRRNYSGCGLARACPHPCPVAPTLCCSSGALPPEDSSRNHPPGDRRNYSGRLPVRPYGSTIAAGRNLEHTSEEGGGRSRSGSPKGEATVEDAEAEVVRLDHEDVRPTRIQPSRLTHQNHPQRNRLLDSRWLRLEGRMDAEGPIIEEKWTVAVCLLSTNRLRRHAGLNRFAGRSGGKILELPWREVTAAGARPGPVR